MDEILDALLEPLRWFGAPDKRVYVPYLACAAALAAFVFARDRRRGSLLSYVFPSRVVLQRSSLLDIRLLFARGLLNTVLVTPRVCGSIAIAISLSRTLNETLGHHPRTQRAWVPVAFAIATFVADDFTRFLLHLAAHRVPALWELHKVHHSAEVLTPLTVYRVHPIEGWLNHVRGFVTTGVVAALFLHFAPGPLRSVTIASVDVIGMIMSVAGANLRHSHVWLSWGNTLEHVFISPAMHQIHHSRRAKDHHMNCGSALAIWDWLFGTLRVAGTRQPTRFGLPWSQLNHHPARLWSVIVHPLLAMARRRDQRNTYAYAKSP